MMCLHVPQIPQFGVQNVLAFAKFRIKIGYLILDVAEYEVLDVEDALN